MPSLAPPQTFEQKKLRDGKTPVITGIIEGYDQQGFKKKKATIDRMFTADRCTETALPADKFTELFKATESFDTDSGDKKIHVYSKNNDKDSLLLFYYVSFMMQHEENPETKVLTLKPNYMVIASRLNNLAEGADDKRIETIPTIEPVSATGGGEKEDNLNLLHRVTKYMEELAGKTIATTELDANKSEQDGLVSTFIKKAEEKLKPAWGGMRMLNKPKIMYTRYTINEKGVDGDINLEQQALNDKYKDIFVNKNVSDTLSTNTYYFNVVFKGFLYNDNFYFEKKIIKKEVVPILGYNGPLKAPPRPGAVDENNGTTDTPPDTPPDTPVVRALVDPNSRVPALLAPSGDSEISPASSMRASERGGPEHDGGGAIIPDSVGGNRKLKRRELNTMSLNELKQLHRNNGINMNSNKTVNALINNYIKHH